MLGQLQKYIPAADAFMMLLGPAQKQWLNGHVDYLAPFLRSEAGQSALLLFLEEFNGFVIAAKTPATTPAVTTPVVPTPVQ